MIANHEVADAEITQSLQVARRGSAAHQYVQDGGVISGEGPVDPAAAVGHDEPIRCGTR